MKKGVPTFKNNLYLLKKIAKISPSRVVCEFLSQILNFGSWAFYTVFFMRYLFGADEITRSFQDIAIFLVITSGIMLLLSGFSAWYNNIHKPKTDLTIAFALNRTLFDKASTVDVSCYEDPDFYDKYTKAASEAGGRAQSVLANYAQMIAALFSASYVVYTIFTINVWAGLFAFLPFFGKFFLEKKGNKRAFNREMEQVPFNRRKNYTDRVMFLPQYSKEVRLTGVFNLVRKTYTEAVDGNMKVIDKHWFGIFLFFVISGVFQYPLVFEGLWLLAAYLAIVQKSILIGEFIVLANAVVTTTLMLSLLSGSIIESGRNALFIQNFRDFMEHIPKIDENQRGLPVEKPQILELRNVSFKYNETGSEILRNVNMTIKTGEKIVLLGHNGAGKTTLVKLLMRLYDPTAGEILLNRINIKEYDLSDYRSAIGTVFQDYRMFSLPVVENVLMSRIENPEQRERAIEALRQSGVYEKVESLSKGADTVLTREFDDEGAILSGGEYQKIAAARAFVKNADILILDEPSSALDPIAEHTMIETIMKLCSGNKLSVIISHRMSTAVTADYVYLLENGEVIEEGVHRDLLIKNGVYASMFLNQARSYVWE